jgi:hypothetical protein
VEGNLPIVSPSSWGGPNWVLLDNEMDDVGNIGDEGDDDDLNAAIAASMEGVKDLPKENGSNNPSQIYNVAGDDVGDDVGDDDDNGDDNLSAESEYDEEAELALAMAVSMQGYK